MTAESSGPKIAVLLCTHNGEAFLKEQLDSYAAQSWGNWFLVVSDDDSTDRTREILLEYQQRWEPGRLEIIPGPARGFVDNFIAITCHAAGRADYYAWSDQDDIWHPDKLERAMRWLGEVPPDVPALYCGRTQLVSRDNQAIGMSVLFRRKPSFGNALMQNIGGGNTMMFNRSACQLLVETCADIKLVAHDWWAYIIVTGCGGRVFYDPIPGVRYRQHEGNVLGENITWRARMMRIRQLLSGRMRDWNDLHTEALRKHHARLTPQSAETLRLFIDARKRVPPMSLLQLKRSEVYRQTFMDNMGLVLAAIFRKI